MKPQVTLQRHRCGRGLTQNFRRNIDKRRATFGDKCRGKLQASAIRQVKRAAVSIENARGAFDDKPMQIVRPDRFGKRFTEPMQEIENERFFDLDFLIGTLQHPDAALLPLSGVDPSGNRGQKESGEKNRPHDGPASLLRRRFVVKVLL